MPPKTIHIADVGGQRERIRARGAGPERPGWQPRRPASTSGFSSERIIFLGSEVRDQNANALCAQMLVLNAEDPEKDIWLYINSPGGSVDAGLAIYDTMQFISNDVATVAMGLAASMGQFLLAAGTKGKRFALPHSRIMMHQVSGGLGGTASDIKIQAAAEPAPEEAAVRAHRAPHRADGRPDRDRRRPRPLVHRRAVPGVRLHRPRGEVRRRGQLRRTGLLTRQHTGGRSTMPSPSHTGPVHRAMRLTTSSRAGRNALPTATARSTPTQSCSRTGSSSSARRSPTTSPTPSWRSCCAWSRWIPTARCRSTSTAPAVRSRR